MSISSSRAAAGAPMVRWPAKAVSRAASCGLFRCKDGEDQRESSFGGAEIRPQKRAFLGRPFPPDFDDVFAPQRRHCLALVAGKSDRIAFGTADRELL